MKVAVVGCGYVGLITGVGLASLGHEVAGVEVDANRRELIDRCEPPFHEPGLADALERTQAAGTFRVSGDLAEVRHAAVVLLCVQTPPGPDGAIDLTALERAAEAVAEHLNDDSDRRTVVVVRSTVVPGTAHRVVVPKLMRERKHRETLAVASNPEFLREGSALEDFLQADRVLVGCETPWARTVLHELYAPLRAPIMMTGIATAELTKYASNALLATMISFSNEIARLAEATPGVDAEDVFDVLHLDRRLRPTADGQQYLTPGIVTYLRAGCGFGGSCLPKDVAALAAYGRAVGEETPVLDAVLTVNASQPARLVDMAERSLGDLHRRAVAVLGLAFKGGTDDLRDSPGLAVVEELLRRGSAVTVYDPLVGAGALGPQVDRGVLVADSLEAAITDVEAILLTTDSEALRRLPDHLNGSRAIVVDGRRILDPHAIATSYSGVGRAPQVEEAEALP
jgi:UDPglucose 6-dehydrogenase